MTTQATKQYNLSIAKKRKYLYMGKRKYGLLSPKEIKEIMHPALALVDFQSCKIKEAMQYDYDATPHISQDDIDKLLGGNGAEPKKKTFVQKKTAYLTNNMIWYEKADAWREFNKNEETNDTRLKEEYIRHNLAPMSRDDLKRDTNVLKRINRHII